MFKKKSNIYLPLDIYYCTYINNKLNKLNKLQKINEVKYVKQKIRTNTEIT